MLIDRFPRIAARKNGSPQLLDVPTEEKPTDGVDSPDASAALPPDWETSAAPSTTAVVARATPPPDRPGPTCLVVALGSRWRGSLSAPGDIRVDGRLAGAIRARETVYVSETGEVDAAVRARTVLVAGRFAGRVRAERLEITPNGLVTADVTTKALVVHDGARLEGQIHRWPRLPFPDLELPDLGRRVGWIRAWRIPLPAGSARPRLHHAGGRPVGHRRILPPPPLVRRRGLALGAGVAFLLGLLFFPTIPPVLSRRPTAGDIADQTNHDVLDFEVGLPSQILSAPRSANPADDSAAAQLAREYDDLLRSYLGAHPNGYLGRYVRWRVARQSVRAQGESPAALAALYRDPTLLNSQDPSQSGYLYQAANPIDLSNEQDIRAFGQWLALQGDSSP
jgi:cytoskeletal protein CcmA (bactofilin family)